MANDDLDQPADVAWAKGLPGAVLELTPAGVERVILGCGSYRPWLVIEESEGERRNVFVESAGDASQWVEIPGHTSRRRFLSLCEGLGVEGDGE